MTPVDLSKFDSARFYLLTFKVKDTKANYELNDFDHLRGSRYNDDNRIARMVLGEIFTECNGDYAEANKKFLSLNSEEIEPYIKNAVLDSASADYYYTYEKVW